MKKQYKIVIYYPEIIEHPCHIECSDVEEALDKAADYIIMWDYLWREVVFGVTAVDGTENAIDRLRALGPWESDISRIIKHCRPARLGICHDLRPDPVKPNI